MRVSDTLGTLALSLAIVASLTPRLALGAPGDLDTTFAGTGIVTQSVFDGDNEAGALAIDSAGRIVVGGYASAAGQTIVARYLPDGQLDTTFDGDGVVTVAGGQFVVSVATRADNGVVVSVAGPGGVQLLGFLESGSFDPSFGTSGIVSVPTLCNDGANLASLAIQPDGRILGAQMLKNPTHEDGLSKMRSECL